MKKIKKTKTKATEKDPWNLTGEKAALLSEACQLDKDKKFAEKRIKEIKKILDLKEKGTYHNSSGDSVIITEQKKQTEPEPKEVYKYMKTKKIARHFWKCVKVQITEIKKYIAENELAKFQDDLDPIKKWSFK